jgi:2-keto-4-pentenoate hydratase/2-oxohepta-3-ene-1,7-dioic acid hydratase in catechol pathway
MKLLAYEHAGGGGDDDDDGGGGARARAGAGVLLEEGVLPLADAADVLPLLAGGESGEPALAAALARARSEHVAPLALADVRLRPPIARPPKFLAVGLNYADHVAESGLAKPEFPVVFNKQSTCVVGPGDEVHIPRVSTMVDYEGELGFVIGRRCRHVPSDRAAEVIAGYLIVNDVTARDWQFKAPTMTLGKSFDTHGPIGPWLVTPDEVGDPHALDLRTYVNDELRQQSNTRELLFDCFALVELLSTVCTLEPGDVIATGTPAGVGAAMDPMGLLADGDVVRVEIDGLGVLENRLVSEPDTAFGL